jgi:hypothetical protein
VGASCGEEDGQNPHQSRILGSEYEGDDAFLADGLFNTLEKVGSFYRENETLVTPPIEKIAPEKPTGSSPLSNLSTNTIAIKIGAKSGSNLALAAAAHLAIVKELPKFSRQELHD